MDDRKLKNLVSSCLKKIRYPNEQSALDAIRRIHKSRNDDLRVYFCNHCLGYHLTHTKKKENKHDYSEVSNKQVIC